MSLKGVVPVFGHRKDTIEIRLLASMEPGEKGRECEILVAWVYTVEERRCIRSVIEDTGQRS
jgi:hypothetical protein